MSGIRQASSCLEAHACRPSRSPGSCRPASAVFGTSSGAPSCDLAGKHRRMYRQAFDQSYLLKLDDLLDQRPAALTAVRSRCLRMLDRKRKRTASAKLVEATASASE